VISLAAGFVVLVVCGAVTAFLVLRDDGRDDRPDSRQAGPVVLPAGIMATAAPDGTVTVVKGGVRGPLVDVYEDFQCPVCMEFYRVNEVTLKNLVGEGRAKVVYHPIVIFAREPLSGNSVRASAAAHCVTDRSRWLAFQDQLFTHQPPEGAAGFSFTDLISYGTAAGVTGEEFESCVRTLRYVARVRQTSQAAITSGVSGTPTVKVNGKAVPTDETLTAEGLRNAVLAAG
jgi:protein-disulfide isomerase